MEIEGTYTLQAAPEEVWQCLMDKQMLLGSVPGIEQLERLDKQTHALTIRIKYAPLMGTYHGRVTITDRQYPSYYRVVVIGEEGQQNTINGEGVVHLNRHDNTTVITYRGTLNIGKLGTLLPPLVVKGGAKLLIQQFFTSLEVQLRAPSSHTSSLPESEEIVSISTVKRAIPRTTILQRIVHLLRLGAGNPTQEEQWIQRIRRVGTASVLLFLVWVGTRLPRK